MAYSPSPRASAWSPRSTSNVPTCGIASLLRSSHGTAPADHGEFSLEGSKYLTDLYQHRLHGRCRAVVMVGSGLWLRRGHFFHPILRFPPRLPQDRSRCRAGRGRAPRSFPGHRTGLPAARCSLLRPTPTPNAARAPPASGGSSGAVSLAACPASALRAGWRCFSSARSSSCPRGLSRARSPSGPRHQRASPRRRQTIH